MTKFSKNLIVIIFLILASFVVVNFVFAQVDLGMEYGEQIGLAGTDPRIIIARIIQVALGFLGIIAVVLIMYAGWMWMTSEGNEEKITKAKNILKNAIIGLIIILSAFSIASFILNKLSESTGIRPGPGGPGPGGGTGGGIGVLGSCTVESIYPEPEQKEVPRNTSIIVSFREEIRPGTICADTNNSEIFCDGDDIITDGRIKIYKSSDEETNFLTAVKVSTSDNKTFIFTPVNYLGSPSESVWYTVYFSNDIEKADGGNIFATCGRDYLEWQFQVSNKLDLIPPQVKTMEEGGVSPKPASTKPRNSIIQINFDEAINPLTISGSADEVKDYVAVKCTGGSDCNPAGDGYFACGSDTCLKGKFVVSNQYRTVEFISAVQCGVNGCGEKIYCLPGGSQIRVELKAAALADCGADNCVSRSPYNNCAGGHCQDDTGQNYPLSSLPLSGVADVALNSLDGNRDANPQGPATFYNENSPNPLTGDNYQWSFSISEEIDLSPPVIESIVPAPNASGVNLSDPILVTFSKLMMSSSLKSGWIIVNNGQEDIEHKLINILGDSVGYWVAKTDIDSDDNGEADKTKAEIKHSIFAESIDYQAQVGSGVKDINQNCFKPSSGPGCTGNPSCCAGTPTAGSECP